MLSHQRVPSRAPVGRWVAQASQRAGGIFGVLERACQVGVMMLWLDDIFLWHAPVLVAVEPHSLAGLAGQRGPHRTGETWGEVLTAWPHCERLGSDAGSGRARGVKLRNDARAATTSAPEPSLSEPVPSGFDVLHTVRERQRSVSRRWASAAPGLETASQAAEPVAKAKQRGSEARGAAGRSRQAWRQAEDVLDQAGAAAVALHRIQAALALWRPDGQRHDRAWAPPPMSDPRREMGGEGWGQVRRVLQAPRPRNHLDWRQAQRAQAVPDPWLRAAVTR
jgi:hypothetical protein